MQRPRKLGSILQDKTFVLDTSAFDDSLMQMAARLSSERTVRMLEDIAREIFRLTSISPIPYERGGLEASRKIHTYKGDKSVIFGYNKIYAFFQDQADRTGVVTITPKKKKALYIPLTERGRDLHQEGRKAQEEGLEWGVDFILRKSVKITIKSYGSGQGPNHYFSGTIAKNKKHVFQTMAKRMFDVLSGEKKKSGQ